MNKSGNPARTTTIPTTPRKRYHHGKTRHNGNPSDGRLVAVGNHRRCVSCTVRQEWWGTYSQGKARVSRKVKRSTHQLAPTNSASRTRTKIDKKRSITPTRVKIPATAIPCPSSARHSHCKIPRKFWALKVPRQPINVDYPIRLSLGYTSPCVFLFRQKRESKAPAPAP